MHLVDANILIDAKNRYYAFGIASGFWAWLEQMHRAGVPNSIGHGDVVVTNEQSTRQARRRIEIPDACVAMDVETVDILTVMRGAGAALHLDGGAGTDASRESAAPMLPGLD